GTVILVPGMKEEHFDRLAAARSICAKFIFFPLATRKDEALQYQDWCRARGIRTKVHTGGVSRSGLSQMCGYDILSWLKPDIAAHISGGGAPLRAHALVRRGVYQGRADPDERRRSRPGDRHHVVRHRDLLVRQLRLDQARGRAHAREE